MKMEQTVFRNVGIKLQLPVNHTEESIRNSEQGENLSSTVCFFLSTVRQDNLKEFSIILFRLCIKHFLLGGLVNRLSSSLDIVSIFLKIKKSLLR
jgi:hypothetical protein